MKTRTKFKPHTTPLPTREICQRHLKSRIFWEEISNRRDLPEDFIREFADYIQWNQFSSNSNVYISKQIFDEFKDRINWGLISGNKNLEPWEIDKYKDLLDWSRLTKWQKLTDEQMYKYSHLLDWKYIDCQKLSIQFMEDYFNRLKIDDIARHQTLTEEFIEKHFEEFEPYMCWISRYQKLSPKFIWKHIDCLNLSGLAENGKIFPYLRSKFTYLVSNKIIPTWWDIYTKYAYKGDTKIYENPHNLSNPKIVEYLNIVIMR